jgi:hypothetical protein
VQCICAVFFNIDNPETGWDPVGSWNKIHGDGKSSTNVLRMQGQLGGDGVHKVRIVSGGGKNLVVWLEGGWSRPGARRGSRKR